MEKLLEKIQNKIGFARAVNRALKRKKLKIIINPKYGLIGETYFMPPNEQLSK